MRRLEQANAVVLARHFNPSILSEYWLVKHGILEEDSKGREQVFIPGLVTVSAPRFAIQAVPERIQLSAVPPDNNSGPLVRDKLGRIIALLPETPYRAVGLNFHWSAVTANTATFAEGLRQMLVKGDSPLFRFFTEEDARFGAYLSKELFGLRVRLDIKPINAEMNEASVEGLLYAFNFNKDLQPETGVQEIGEVLALWDEALEFSEQVFDRTARWIENDNGDDAA